jgi:hypothetical protein
LTPDVGLVVDNLNDLPSSPDVGLVVENLNDLLSSPDVGLVAIVVEGWEHHQHHLTI